MDNLALAYVTCDKYSHIWKKWHDAFIGYWDIHLPKYFCGESDFELWDGWTIIPHPPVEAERWTSKLRAQIEQIPQENIFVWLDDLVLQFPINKMFVQIYSLFNTLNADSFRIMPRASASDMEGIPHSIGRNQVMKLKPYSKYSVSFHPNIFKKEFLLDVLKYDESAWDCELGSYYRIVDRDIYSVQIGGWVTNEIVKGVKQ